jgi:WD40 repeat protein
VEWSADQRFILSASHDRTVRIWEVATGQCVRVLAGHTHAVVNAAWCPDQRHVVSCDERACLRVWDLEE